MVRKVEVVTNWGVQFLGVDSRSVTVETLFKLFKVIHVIVIYSANQS